MMNIGELQYCVAQEILSRSHEVSVRTFTDNTDEWSQDFGQNSQNSQCWTQSNSAGTVGNAVLE